MGFAQRRRATGWKGHAGQRDGGRNARIFSCAAVALVIGGVFALALMLLPLVSTTSGLGRGASLPMRTMPARVRTNVSVDIVKKQDDAIGEMDARLAVLRTPDPATLRRTPPHRLG